MIRTVILVVAYLAIAIAQTSIALPAASSNTRSFARSGGESAWLPSVEARSLIGKRAPEFAGDLEWVNSKPLTIARLRGRPIFIRFWFRGCAMCQKSAPFLNELQQLYAKTGLVVLGIDHPKSGQPDTKESVRSTASAWGFLFPIAIDNNWSTHNRYWSSAQHGDYTSASFLIDETGKIAWVHDGGELLRGSPAAASLHNILDKLLSSARNGSIVRGSGSARKQFGSNQP